jgi:hypothetical protein
MSTSFNSTGPEAARLWMKPATATPGEALPPIPGWAYAADATPLEPVEAEQFEQQRQAVLSLCVAARVGSSMRPIDCTDSCLDSDCDCSGKFRAMSWTLDPAAVAASLGADLAALTALTREETP